MRNQYFEEAVKIACGFILIIAAIFMGTTMTMNIVDYCKIKESLVQKELDEKEGRLNDLNKLIDELFHRRDFPEIQ